MLKISMLSIEKQIEFNFEAKEGDMPILALINSSTPVFVILFVFYFQVGFSFGDYPCIAKFLSESKKVVRGMFGGTTQ